MIQFTEFVENRINNFIREIIEDTPEIMSLIREYKKELPRNDFGAFIPCTHFQLMSTSSIHSL